MIHPELAAEILAAIEAWQQYRIRRRQPLPDGWAAYREVVAAAARQHHGPADPDWLTLDQAATRAHVSPSTLYRWRQDGLASTTVGGRVLIARTDLDRWLRSVTERSAPVRSSHKVA